jgi:hypothetical protein
MQPSGVLRMMSPLLAPMMRKRNVKYLETLKRLVESG